MTWFFRKPESIIGAAPGNAFYLTETVATGIKTKYADVEEDLFANVCLEMEQFFGLAHQEPYTQVFNGHPAYLQPAFYLLLNDAYKKAFVDGPPDAAIGYSFGGAAMAMFIMNIAAQEGAKAMFARGYFQWLACTTVGIKGPPYRHLAKIPAATKRASQEQLRVLNDGGHRFAPAIIRHGSVIIASKIELSESDVEKLGNGVSIFNEPPFHHPDVMTPATEMWRAYLLNDLGQKGLDGAGQASADYWSTGGGGFAIIGREPHDIFMAIADELSTPCGWSPALSNIHSRDKVVSLALPGTRRDPLKLASKTDGTWQTVTA